MKLLLAFLGSLALITGLGASGALAQYPPGEEPISVTLSDPNPDVGETITVDIVVNPDQAQAPRRSRDGLLVAWIPPVGVQPAAAAYQQEPPFDCTSGLTGGSGATVTPTSFQTDDQGRATLSVFTGTQPATLTLTIVCGEFSSQVLIPVGTATTPAPPDTGAGTNPNSPLSGQNVFLAGIVAVLVLSVSGSYLLVQRRRNGR